MKKLIYPMFGLAALAMTNSSCSDELNNGTTNDNEATVSFKVQLENAVGSRALIGDGTKAKYLFFAVYKTDATEPLSNEIENLAQMVDVNEDLTATINTRLVKGQKYDFVFWAQTENVEDGTYYNVSDMSCIEVKYADDETTTDKVESLANANNEDRDAFYAVYKNLKVTGPVNETVTLKRPFAQVNVGTKLGSLAEAATAEVSIDKSEITIEQVATKLNTYNGQVSDPVTVTYQIAALPSQNLKEVTIDGVTSDYEYLSMNYILVNDDNTVNGVKDGSNQGIVSADLTLYAGTEAINTFEIPNIPVQRNWRTNIIGDILSETVTFNIVIDPKFDNDHNYEIAKELAYILKNGGEYTLEENLTIGNALVVEEGVRVVLNLNGHDITAASSHAIHVSKDAHLTINGEGTVSGGAGGDFHAICAEGKVIINGGTYTVGADANGAGNSCIEAKAGGEVIVNGGTFSTAEKYSDMYWVLNLVDKADAKIVVYGGKFVGCNPSATGTEPTGYSDNFVADGYTAVNTGTDAAPVYEVIVAATADANGNVALPGDGVVMNSISLTTGGTLDGKGYTLTVADVPATNQLVKGTGDATVKNLTIEGNGEYYDTDKSTRALYFDGTLGDVIISNVHVSGVGYALNVNTNAGSGKLSVSNSTLVGWSSFAAVFTEAKFTNVHFGIGTYFGDDSMFNGGIRPYQSAVFEDCTFDQGFYISWEEIDATESLTFKNCKVGETVLDATNIATLLKYEGTPDADSIKFQ